MKSIIYARVSTTNDEQEIKSREATGDVTCLADQLDSDIVEVIVERHRGYDLNREGLYHLFHLIKSRQIEAILVQDDTRLGRGEVKLAIIQFKRHFCRIFS